MNESAIAQSKGFLWKLRSTLTETPTHLWNALPQDFFVDVFIDLLSVVVRLQDQLDLVDRALLTLDLLQKLKKTSKL